MPAPYPDDYRARAVELYRELRSAAAARRRLRDETGRAPATSTIKAWAAAAGVAGPGSADEPPKNGGATPADATEARLRLLEHQRGELSIRLLDRLSGPAVDLIGRRLGEAVIVEDLVARARENLEAELTGLRTASEVLSDELAKPAADRDAKVVEAADDARKSARSAVQDARLALRAVLDARISLRDLVGVAHRSIVDHLALEGLAGPELPDAARGAITVELVMPDVDPDEARAAAVPEDELGDHVPTSRGGT